MAYRLGGSVLLGVQVESLKVINNNRVRVILKPHVTGNLQDVIHGNATPFPAPSPSSISTSSSQQPQQLEGQQQHHPHDSHHPHRVLYFQIGSVTSFEKKLDQAQVCARVRACVCYYCGMHVYERVAR